MSASYQCPKCSQVIPTMDLDDAGAPHCPCCEGATRAGTPPPAPAEPAPATYAVAPVWDHDSPPADDAPLDLDIRRKSYRKPASAPAAASSWSGKHIVWPAIVVGIIAVRIIAVVIRHDPAPMPPPPPILQGGNFIIPLPPAIPDQNFQMHPPLVPGEILIEPARWSTFVPEATKPMRLLSAGPDNQRLGVVFGDADTPETLFLAIDGANGAEAGRILWNGPARPIGFSLARDGSRLAVLLEVRGQRATRRFRVHALPGGDVVGKEWFPVPAVKQEAGDLWFEMLGPDQLLTVYQGRECELWSLPDGKRLWTVALDAAEPRKQALAISPDRRMLAVANPAGGFTFYDTATGKARGRTEITHGPAKRLHSWGFGPDGRSFGCLMTIADHNEADRYWLRWSCPAGTETGFWASTCDRITFWDNEQVLTEVGDGKRRGLCDAQTGRFAGTLEFHSVLAFALAGQQLCYLCEDPQRLVNLVVIDRGFAPLRPGLMPPGAGVRRVTPQGLTAVAGP